MSDRRLLKKVIWSLLLCYALLSISRGARNALKYSQDLAPVYKASCLWLNRHNPYAAYTNVEWERATGQGAISPMPVVAYSTPYPPIALMNLGIVSWLPWKWARGGWLLVNLGLAAAFPVLIWRTWYPDWSRSQFIPFALLWFCGLGLRVGLGLGQHSLFSATSVLVGFALLKGNHPLWAGILLAISLHKFQISAVFVALLAAKGCIRVVGATAATVCVLLALFLFWIDSPTSSVVSSYLKEFGYWWSRSEGGGLSGMGATHLYPILLWFAPSKHVAQSSMYALSGLGLIVLAILAHRTKGLPAAVDFAAFSLFALWSMYNGIPNTILLIVPILVLSQYVARARSAKWRFSLRTITIWLLLMWLTDASKPVSVLLGVSLDRLQESLTYRILDPVYRLGCFAAFLAIVFLQVQAAWKKESKPVSQGSEHGRRSLAGDQHPAKWAVWWPF